MNLFGEVIDGWIKLRALIEQFRLILNGWDPEAPGNCHNIKMSTINGAPEGTISRFNFAFTDDDAPQEAKKNRKKLRRCRYILSYTY